jgi:hypothetical protein
MSCFASQLNMMTEDPEFSPYPNKQTSKQTQSKQSKSSGC